MRIAVNVHVAVPNWRRILGRILALLPQGTNVLFVTKYCHPLLFLPNTNLHIAR